VGFIRKLPHDIVAAFRATLEEVREADLLLHVIDVSNAAWREQAQAVKEVLAQLGVAGTPVISVYNKADLLSKEASEELPPIRPGDRSVIISARAGTGLDNLMRDISGALESFAAEIELKIPYAKAGVISRLHEQGRVIAEVYESDGVRVNVVMPRSAARQVRRYLLHEDDSEPE